MFLFKKGTSRRGLGKLLSYFLEHCRATAHFKSRHLFLNISPWYQSFVCACPSVDQKVGSLPLLCCEQAEAVKWLMLLESHHGIYSASVAMSPVFPFVPCNIIGNISSIWPWPKGLSHSIMILPEIIIVKWLNILINRAAIYTWVGCALRNAKRSILILIYVNNFKNNSVCVCN